MNKNLFLLLVGSVTLMTGCTLSPDYTRPEAPIAAGWPTGAAYREIETTAGGPAAPDLRWQEIFTDERLQKLIETALSNNRDLRLAALNVQRARALYGIQRVELFPSFNAAGSGSRQRVPADLSATGNRMTAEQYGVNFGISSWEIDFFGRLRSLETRALEEYLATEQARRSAQILLVSAVSNAYLSLAANREHLKLSESTLETQEEVYHLIRRRYELGIASELDLRRAQTQVDTARGDIARFTQLVAQDENALNLLAGSASPLPDEILPADLASVTAPREICPGIQTTAGVPGEAQRRDKLPLTTKLLASLSPGGARPPLEASRAGPFLPPVGAGNRFDSDEVRKHYSLAGFPSGGNNDNH